MSEQTSAHISGFRIAPVQEQLWSEQNGTALFRTECTIRCHGRYTPAHIEEAARQLVQRYEILRTHYVSGGGRRFPLQVVGELSPSAIVTEDSDELALSTSGTDALAMEDAQFLQIHLSHSGEDENHIVLSAPSISCDSRTLLLLAEELISILKGEDGEVDEDEILQYTQYAEWSRQFTEEPDDEADEFWENSREDLTGLPHLAYHATEVPFNPAVSPVIMRSVNTAPAIANMATELSIPAEDLLASIWGSFLSALGRAEHITLRCDLPGREFEELEGVVGKVSRTVPISATTFGASARTVVQHVAQTLEAARENSDYYPFDEPLSAAGNSAGFEAISYEAPADLFAVESLRSVNSRFLLKLSALFDGEGFRNAEILYDNAVLDAGSAGLISEMFAMFVEEFLANPDHDIEHYPLLDYETLDALHHNWNASSGIRNTAEDVLARIERAAGEIPEATAVTGTDKDWKYRELMSRADAIAEQLLERGIGKGDVVAFCLHHSPDAVAAIPGIMKTGAAFLPVDPSLPEARKIFMAQDSNARLVLVTSDTGKAFDEAVPTLFMEEIPSESAAPVESMPADPDDTAYIIYTSGSTGTPKGCLIRRRNIAAYIGWATDYYFSESDAEGHWPLFTSLSFDLTITSIFCSLSRGKSIAVFGDTADMTDVLKNMFSPESEIDTVKMTPAQTTLLAGTGLTGTNVRAVILGGEQLQRAHVETLLKLNPDMKIFNEYGPTETTVGCTVAVISTPDERITIGTPIAGAAAYLSRDGQALCAPYQIGELWIAGDGVGAGYLNRPELTAERFRDDLPFTHGATAYRTGDLARRYPDGTLEYLGRNDDQIKVRGYRIEPGEVRSRIQDIKGIADAAVIGKEAADGSTELVAYYVPETDNAEATQPSALKEELGRLLPEYMVPGFFIPLQKIPLTINGKPDTAQLPDPADIQLTTEYVAPQNDAEETIAGIWSEILGVERVGVNDDFFLLGGHSLRAMRAIARINTALDANLKVNEIFAHPTVADLANQIGHSTGGAAKSIERIPDSDYYELSDSQRRLWVLEQMEDVGDAFHIAGAFDMSGSFSPEIFTRAFASLIERHEILRTTFHVENKLPVQRIHPASEEQNVSVYNADLRQKTNVQDALDAELKDLTLKPFDLSRGPLIRAGIYRTGDERYTLAIAMHHIIADGWSVGIMIDELTSFYTAHAQGKESSLEPLRIQYRDFAAWQAQKLRDDSLAESRRYWIEKLSGATPLDLPLDYPRPQIKTYNGDVERFTLDAGIYRKLSEYTRESGASMFMVLLAAYKVLLSKYSGQEDITVGTAIAGRDHPDLDDQIGFYVNILALRDSIGPDESFADVLNKVRSTATDAYAHQTYPFDKLIDELGVERETGRSPLFDVFLVMQNNEEKKLGFGDAVLTERHTPGTPGKYDLAFEFIEADGSLQGEVTYSTDVFAPQRIRNLVRYLTTLLGAVTGGKDSEPISSLPLLQPEELTELTTMPEEEFATELSKTIPQLFNEAALRFPDKVAVQGAEGSYTYNQLRTRSNGLASFFGEIMDRNPESSHRIAVLLPRSEAITLIYLGILKANASYVPIDANYPSERVRRMLQDCGADIVITDSNAPDFVPENMLAIPVGKLHNVPGQEESPGPDGSPDDIAVIMYTSGSTGVPKGVLMQHKGLINTAYGTIRELHTDADSNILQFASISFDSSLCETHLALVTGATLTVVPRSVIDAPEAFITFLAEKKITAAILPPAYLTTLNKHELPTLKTILTAGEPPVMDDAMFYTERCLYINGYGPSECAICVSTYHVRSDADYRSGIPIGKEMPNTLVVITDSNMNILPPGLEGEICVVGSGVGPGYLNEEQTRKAFIEHPLFPGKRMYRTGDLGRRQFDGNIAFRGRIDNQVKVRGHRVEPEETAAHLREHPSISEATVITRRKEGESTQLIACLVAEEGSLEMSKIRIWLSERLPTYMVPSYFVQFDELPTTPNGKVDRRALLALAEEQINAEVKPQTNSAATDEEQVLIRSVATTLGLNDVSPEDNYFMIGGDSIKAIQLTWKLREEGYDLQVRDIFANPRLADAAMYLRRNQDAADNEAVEGTVPLTPIQKWFFSSWSPAHRNHFNQSVLLRKQDGYINAAQIEQLLHRLADHHDMLRATFDSGADQTVQTLAEPGAAKIAVSVHDLSDAADQNTAFEEVLREAHTKFNIADGPLVNASVITRGGEDFLYLVVHHLVIDAVSWHILVSDILSGYDALERGEDISGISLPPRTTSYKAWAEKLQELADSDSMKEATGYWNEVSESLTSAGTIPVHTSAGNTYQDSETLHLELDAETTGSLLGTANEAYNTEPRDLILAALGSALCRESNAETCVIGLEGHGRSVEELNNTDVSRTIGWFTSLYPVSLGGQTSAERIKQTKEYLRTVPMQGLSYGIGCYLASDATAIPDILGKAQLVLNYFGVENTTEEEGTFVVEGEPEGLGSSPEATRLFEIEVIAAVRSGKLSVDVSFCPGRIARETVDRIMNTWMLEIAALIDHCAQVDAPELTPSDVDYDGLSIDDLDDILSNITG